MPMHIIT